MVLSVGIAEASAIGARARMIRRRRGLSLEVVAGLAGITKQYLSALELGQRGFNRRGSTECGTVSARTGAGCSSGGCIHVQINRTLALTPARRCR
ncbi:MAG: helix-turn-helix domain-containing protein [Pseudonocardiaceae bacterium]